MTMRPAQRISAPWDDDFSLDDYPLYNLNRTSATYMEAMARALKNVDLDQAQWRVLSILGDRAHASLGDIARRGVIKLSTLTRILDRMERDGLITRKPSCDDRRITETSLTKIGEKALRKARALNGAIYQHACEGISAEDIEHTMHVLKVMRHNMECAQVSLPAKASQKG